MPSVSSHTTRLLESLYGLDVRSMALFRMSLGILLLVDLSVRARWLVAHYTDHGVLPRSVLFELFPRPLFLSVHMLSGDILLQVLLFTLAALAAVALLVGYRTRLATALSWFLLLSLHIRNPVVLNSGDTLLLLLLFWSLFLPLGRFFSLDAHRINHQRPQSTILSVATFAILLQVCFIYWFSVFLKTDPVWRTDYTAVFYALSLDRLTTPLGLWLLEASPTLLQGLTQATLWLEYLGPILVFFPILPGFFRTVVPLLFIGFHVGLALHLTLGIFPWVCIGGWLLFLPSSFWNRLMTAATRFSTLQPYLLSWVGPWHKPLFPFTNRPIYIVSNSLALLALTYIVTYNVYSVGWMPTTLHSYFTPVTTVGQTLNLNQKWGMFAPYPSLDDGWYVMVGTLKDGSQVDVFNPNQSVSWDKPELVSATYKNQRWRKFLGERLLEHQDALAPIFASYLWRTWNRQHLPEQHLTDLQVYLMYESNHPLLRLPEPQKRLIWERSSSCSPDAIVELTANVSGTESC